MILKKKKPLKFQFSAQQTRKGIFTKNENFLKKSVH